MLIDTRYGVPGGPPGEPVQPGAVLTLTDPRTGTQSAKTVAGLLKDGTAFYGMIGGEFRYPVLMSPAAVKEAFGAGARPSSMLLRTAPGLAPERLAAELQGRSAHPARDGSAGRRLTGQTAAQADRREIMAPCQSGSHG